MFTVLYCSSSDVLIKCQLNTDLRLLWRGVIVRSYLETRYQKLLSKTQYNTESEKITPGCKFQIKKKHKHITANENRKETSIFILVINYTKISTLTSVK